MVHYIYLPRNRFSNYVYLNDMCMNLKGIGKILFVSVLRILIICKTLNFTAVFTKKLKFPKFAFNFLCEKVNFTLTHGTHITIHSFWRSLLSSQVLPVVSKSYIQTKSKTSDYSIFQFLRVHLYIRPPVGHELTAIGTRVQGFNLWLIS